jgi:hypothetical protein
VALAAGAAATSAVSLGIIRLLSAFKIKLGVAALVATGIILPLFLQQRTVQQLRLQLADLQRRNGQLQAQFESKPDAQIIPRELLRLRGQVARLRRELDEKSTSPQPATSPLGLSATQLASLSDSAHWRDGTFLPKEKISNRGLATPEGAVQTYLWALLQEDIQVARNVLGDGATVDLEKERDEFADRINAGNGLSFASSKKDPNSFVALLEIEDTFERKWMKRVELNLQGGDWRVISDQWTPLLSLRAAPTIDK